MWRIAPPGGAFTKLSLQHITYETLNGVTISVAPLWKNKNKLQPPFLPCIVDGAWEEWTPWSLCSSTCGRGFRERTRTCKPPQNGGEPCVGPAKQTKYCNIAVCPGESAPLFYVHSLIYDFKKKKGRKKIITAVSSVNHSNHLLPHLKIHDS